MKDVVVVDYRTDWPLLFKREQVLITQATGISASDIHHIGSTSVEGLAAKPVIDILIEINDLAVLDNLNEQFCAIDYTPRGENSIDQRRYFTKGHNKRTHQIHGFIKGSDQAIRHLAFCRYLRAHPDAAFKYGELKKQIAKTCNNDIEKYCDEKNDFVQQHEKLALIWENLN